MSEPVSALGQDAAPELLGPSLSQTLSPPSLESAPPNQYPQANENNLQPSNSISAQTSPPLDPPLDLSPTLTPRSPEPVALVTRGSQSSLLNPPNIISDLASLVDRSQLQRLLDLQRSISENLASSLKALGEVTQSSEREYAALRDEYRKSTKLIAEMKSDLEYITEKIRKIKTAMRQKYGDIVPQSSYVVEDDD